MESDSVNISCSLMGSFVFRHVLHCMPKDKTGLHLRISSQRRDFTIILGAGGVVPVSREQFKE